MSSVSRISLEEAFSQALLYFRRPEAIVRVVLSGRRRNMQTSTERIDIRPVVIKELLHFQVSTSDGRAVTTKNYLPTELPIDEYIRSGYANILIEGVEGQVNRVWALANCYISCPLSLVRPSALSLLNN